jgi:hypothetical protein
MLMCSGRRVTGGDGPNDFRLSDSQKMTDVWQDEDCWSDEEEIQEGLLEQVSSASLQLIQLLLLHGQEPT